MTNIFNISKEDRARMREERLTKQAEEQQPREPIPYEQTSEYRVKKQQKRREISEETLNRRMTR